MEVTIKKRLVILCVVLIAVLAAVLAGCTPTAPAPSAPQPEVRTVLDVTKFPAWVQSDGVWSTVGNRSSSETSTTMREIFKIPNVSLRIQETEAKPKWYP